MNLKWRIDKKEKHQIEEILLPWKERNRDRQRQREGREGGGERERENMNEHELQREGEMDRNCFKWVYVKNKERETKVLLPDLPVIGLKWFLI